MRRSVLAAAGATSRPRLAELPPRLIQIICPLNIPGVYGAIAIY
jgi:hypothetical protein